MSRRFRNLILLLAVVLGFAGRALAADTMLTISGTEQKVAGAWDTAKITISFTDKLSNTYTEQVTYGQFSTPASIASSFGALFSNTYFQNGELCAFAVGGNIYFHLKGSDTFGWPTITIQDTLTTSPSFSVSTASWQAPAAGPTPLGITWPNPVIVPYGTPLAALQPFAKIYANTGAGKFEVAGTFTYTSATPGVSLGPTLTTLGTQSLYYTFIPADTTNYPITNCASSNCAISLNVVTAAPAIVWPPPAAITYNTALSAAQLNAMVSVSGTLSACLISTTPSVANTCYYSQPLGTILTPGKQTLTVTYTPTNTTDFASVTATVILNVNKAEPTITWSPAAMSSATLTTAQLNASSSLAGSTFTYSVGAKTVTAGTVLPTGENLLTVTATPPGASAQYFEPVTRTVPITVGAGATFDQGTATLTVGGVVASTYSYKQYDTPSSIAAGLAAGLLPCTATNSNPQPCVTLAAVDNSLYMQATPAAVSAYASIGSSTDFSYSLNIPQGTGFTEPSFQVTPPSGNLDGGASSGAAVTPIYTFCVAGSGNPDCTLTGTGYDPAGNLLSYTDAGTNGPIMGTWKFQYDTLNRLAGATDNQPGNTNTNYCWSYDAFGNRQQQAGSNALFTNSVGAPTCTAANGASFNNVWARYTVDGTTSTPDNGKNQVTATPAGNVIYDPSGAGYILNDAVNQYLYDGEGRICAVAATNAFGATLYTGYLYDADGTRVAKGTITTWSCDPTLSGFKTTNDYLLGPGGEQLTEMGIDTTVSGSTATNTLTWQHANIWAGGKLLGTYDKNGLHFYFDDPLGTRRAQTDYAGVLEQTCASLPYGDSLACTGGDLQAPTEHHFTGKERDVESGNDYFEARYYSSAIARFLSADEAFADQHPADPQSWNLYMYAGNNPLGFVDRTGRGKAGDIAWGVVSGTGLFLYNSTPIPGAVTGVKMLAHFAANPSAAIAESNAQGEHDRAAIANTMKALGSSQGRAALAKAAGDAWNGQTLVQKTQVITQLTLGVGVAVVGGVAGSARSVGASSEALAARVTEIHGALDPIAQTMRTTAGAGTEEGISIFAGGKRDLIPAQRALLVPGEIAAKLPGADAEITIMSAAAKNGLNLTDLRVTRPICSDCQSAIEGSGGRLTSDRSATWRK